MITLNWAFIEWMGSGLGLKVKVELGLLEMKRVE